MKGFIEVTNSEDVKVLINISYIQVIAKNELLLMDGTELYLNESYEQIKELIKNAQ